MIPLRRKFLLDAIRLFDLAAMVLSFLLATSFIVYSAEKITFAQFLSMRVKVHNAAIFFGLLVCWYKIFSFFGLYYSRRLSSRRDEIFDVAKATTVGTLILGIVALLFQIRMVTPTFLAAFWAVSSGIIILNRVLLRYGLDKIRIHGRNLRFLLIVGTNPRAIHFAEGIQRRPELGFKLIGFVDEEWASNGQLKEKGYIRVSDFESLPFYLKAHVVDEVIIFLPLKSLYDQAFQIAKLCEQQGITVRFPSDLFSLQKGEMKAEQFEEDSVVTFYTGQMRGWQILVKRVLDFFFSLILLLLLLPLFLVVACLIKINSPGPAIFVQERIGLNKRIFSLYKFRTMVPEAEKMQAELETLNEAEGPVFKIKDDPRITPIGKFLRKTSLDEFPQFFNVLKGDMSLVGPRPLPIRDYDGFDKDWHRRRFSVRPGITCSWQVDGRSDIAFEDWMRLDMEYIDNWSLGLDLKILLKTIPAVLKGSGAA